MTTGCPREDIALLALGVLGADETRELDSHLQDCTTCARERDELAGVASVLAGADRSVVEQELAHGDSLAAHRARRQRRQVPRRRTLAAAAAVAAAVVAGVSVSLESGLETGGGSAGSTSFALHPGTLTGATGTAVVRPLGGNSGQERLRLELHRMPIGEHCSLQVRTATASYTVATWVVTYRGDVILSAPVPVPADAIRSVVVERTGTATVLLSG